MAEQTTPKTAIAKKDDLNLKRIQPEDSFQSEMDMSTAGGFELLMRAAQILSNSELLPMHFRGEKGIPNIVLALDLSKRMGIHFFTVAQALYVVHGKPGWMSTFIISTINLGGRFHPLQFKLTGTGDDRGCVAFAKEKASGQICEGTRVDVNMAKKEGWWGKNGSKWPTMTDQMLCYRAATFFGRLHAPESLCGIATIEEVEDTMSDAISNMATSGSATFVDAPPIRTIETREPDPNIVQESRQATVDAVPSGQSENQSPSDVSQLLPSERLNPVPEGCNELQTQMLDYLESIQVPFDRFVTKVGNLGWIKNPGSVQSVKNIDDETLKRLLTGKKALKAKLEEK